MNYIKSVFFRGDVRGTIKILSNTGSLSCKFFK